MASTNKATGTVKMEVSLPPLSPSINKNPTPNSPQTKPPGLTVHPPSPAQLVAFRYWQEQIVFRGPNGSGKVYLAHGSTWTCVKGQMNAYLEDAHETLYGNSKDNWDQVWGGPCKCYFDLSTDMGFYVAH